MTLNEKDCSVRHSHQALFILYGKSKGTARGRPLKKLAVWSGASEKRTEIPGSRLKGAAEIRGVTGVKQLPVYKWR